LHLKNTLFFWNESSNIRKNYEMLNLLKPRKPNYYCLNYEKSILVALLFVESHYFAQTKDELALKEIYKS
jgi:hypothetical protein